MKLASIFKDGMILQRNRQNRIWGTSSENEIVKIEFAGKIYITKGSYKSDERVWHIDLLPQREGGPFEMVVTGSEEVVIKDILIGEVWLAGGQSNMELELQNSDDGKSICKNSDFNEIRFYNVPKVADMDKVSEEEEKTRWKSAKGDNCLDVSAVAYYFAKKLYNKLNVPIGIIDCYWGGTSATCWGDSKRFEDIEGAKDYLKEWDDVISTKSDEQYQKEMDEYNAEYNAWNARVEKMREEDPKVTWEVINEKAGLCPWPQPMGSKSPFRPFGLYETMVKRVVPYGVRGFIYYQAEEDWSRSKCYNLLNEAVIDTWNRDFNIFDEEKMPFLLTQLPMYIAKGEEDNKTFAALRSAQSKVARDNDNVEMACIIDCGEFDNIHPTDKKTPGERLARIALGKVYGMDEVYKNMRIKEAKFNGEEILVEFENTYEDIRVRYSNGEFFTANVKDEISVFDIDKNEKFKIYGFKVSEDGKDFKECDVNIRGKEVYLHAHGVKKPAYISYAWTDFGVANLYNKAGLPLEPDVIKVKWLGDRKIEGKSRSKKLHVKIITNKALSSLRVWYKTFIGESYEKEK